MPRSHTGSDTKTFLYLLYTFAQPTLSQDIPQFLQQLRPRLKQISLVTKLPGPVIGVLARPFNIATTTQNRNSTSTLTYLYFLPSNVLRHLIGICGPQGFTIQQLLLTKGIDTRRLVRPICHVRRTIHTTRSTSTNVQLVHNMRTNNHRTTRSDHAHHPNRQLFPASTILHQGTGLLSSHSILHICGIGHTILHRYNNLSHSGVHGCHARYSTSLHVIYE